MVQPSNRNPAQWTLEERWQIIMENVQDYAIFMLDPDGKIATWNEGAQRILGYTEQEIVGHDFCDIFTPEDIGRNQPEMELEGARKRGRAEDERWHLRKDGSRFWAAGIVTSLWDDSGKLRGFAKILRDITDRKKAQEALIEENRQKDEFLAVLSHELRNPLAGISNSVELLSRGLVVPDLIEIVARQTATLRRLVDDLLDITRIRTGKVSLTRERVTVSELVERAASETNHLLEARQQQLNIQLPPESITLEADAVRLQQVLGNLLSNASRYSPTGSPIDIRAERLGNELLLTVRDVGIGISAEMLPRIFEMFVQADRTLHRSQGGLGIGLTLAQRIVQMHGGSIQASSAGIGNGSEFSIRLPVIPDGKDAITPANSTSPSQPDPLKILIAEDNKDSAATMGILLRNLGHQVEIAHDGSVALEIAVQFQPDAMLVDIGLPVLSGYDVAKRVRQLPQLQRTTLLAVTGYGSPDDVERAMKAGFDFHLVKPVSFDELQELLSSIGKKSLPPLAP